jgi:hypothetical protein
MAAKRSLMLTCCWKLPCVNKVVGKPKGVNSLIPCRSAGAYNVPLEAISDSRERQPFASQQFVKQ